MSKTNQEQKDVPVPDNIASHPAWIRLTDQLGWYDRRSNRCHKIYKTLKLIQIILAVGIPVATHLPDDWAKWVTSIAGALIAILEGIQHMNQYSTLWVMYRSTAERLKHEKYLFLSEAGPFRGLQTADRFILLAERVEEHVSTEHANWFNETRQGLATKKGNTSGH